MHEKDTTHTKIIRLFNGEASPDEKKGNWGLAKPGWR